MRPNSEALDPASVVHALATGWARRYPPHSASRPASAAVAVIVAPGVQGQPQLLFIQRPRRRGDRWSGDVAFPGGMSTPGERAVDVARRETMEEIGLRLGAPVASLPRALTLRPGSRRLMRVRPVLFVLNRVVDIDALAIDPREVDRVFLVGLDVALRRPSLRPRRVGAGALLLPTVDLGEGRVLWGLSLGMARSLGRS